ncbi:hypothetical protein HYFRA_00010126 [Hymenoscyphus fraxineus]|uniref:FAD/NAD(P)-binding domain-containing protein n=1 Tax=Hymenoscyphus fraxineus TaxID=746836 RepID=A0A9N9KTV9_9HELO|nr:hypothetical protein HYFRA_00010126 [Hymenoscyphus fraxineus]
MNLQSNKNYEVVIIGAGISGIIAAQRYLEAHPKCRLTILEKDLCVGGVFGKRRIYPGFWTQWSFGHAEFSDMAMERPPEEDIKHGCFKAKYTTEYLEKYVDEKLHNGSSLRDRIQFGMRVTLIEYDEGMWKLCCTDANNSPVTLLATKLMVANGQNSLPNMPNLPGKDDFGGVVMHSEDFGASNVLSLSQNQNIAVIGAGKSSADMIYEAVKAGKAVTWIIRKEGCGAGFFAPIDLKTPYESGGHAALTRIMAQLQPSLLNKEKCLSGFINRTSLGMAITKGVFSKLDSEIKEHANYTGRGNTKGFEGLEYDTGIFWQNGTGGALHHKDFFDLIAEKVTVYRGTVKKLGHRMVHLDDGSQFPCDVVLCGTGWKVATEFFKPDLLLKLGLPYHKENEPKEVTEKWEGLALEADKKVLTRFPLLADPPPHFHKDLKTTPYRLFRCIAPINIDSIVFLNHLSAGSKLFAAEAQAMWAVAYFDKNVSIPSIEDREKDVATWNAWCRRRYLSNGEGGNFAAFDSVPYVDTLLEDVGATAHFKGSWWKDMFVPYRPSDLGQAWKEYLKKSGSRG